VKIFPFYKISLKKVDIEKQKNAQQACTYSDFVLHKRENRRPFFTVYEIKKIAEKIMY
jgi:hypothetical protein